MKISIFKTTKTIVSKWFTIWFNNI